VTPDGPRYGVSRKDDAMKELKGRNAMVTGASRGIGVHIARALAREGVNLVLVARSADAIEQLSREFGASGVRAVAIPADLGDVAGLDALLSRAEADLGPIDVLVNNAGIDAMRSYPEESDADIEQMLRIDLLSPMMLTRRAVSRMLARGARGHVVNVASLAGKTAAPYMVSYASAKAGLVNFSLSLRDELRDRGIGVSVICPGFISEEGMFAQRAETTGARVSPLLGTSRPEQVAAAVVSALRENRAEVIVNPGPVRLMQILNQFSPDAMAFVQRHLLNLNTLTSSLALADKKGDGPN
jgi:short-subunit dehydrogenase